MKELKTRFRLTANRKVWRSILTAMDLYPTNCIHIDTDLGGGICVRWAYTEDDADCGHQAGEHVQHWDMKVTGKMKTRDVNKLIVLQMGDHDSCDKDLYSWDTTRHTPIPDAREWIEDHLEMNETPEIFYNYNTKQISTSTIKPFSLSD